MKNPSVPSRCGSVCRNAGTLGWSQTGRSDGRSVEARSRRARPGSCSIALVLRRTRSCRSSRRARRRAAARAAPASRIAACMAASSAAVAGCLAPAGVRARRERAEVRARRVDEHAVVGAPSTRLGGVGGADLDAASAPIRSAVRAQRRRRGPGGARRRRPRPRLPISAARWVVLPPGAAHRSSTCSPGSGASSARDRHRGARLRHEQRRPRTQRRGRTRRTGRRARALRGAVGAACDATGSCAASVVAARSAACWRARRPRPARCRRPSARARSSGPSASHHSSAIQSGCEWRSAASPGVPSGSAATSAARLARGAAQDGVDEPARRVATRTWRARPTRVDGGVRRDAVEEQRAGSTPEPQRGEHGGLEPLDAAARRASRSRSRASPGAGRRRTRARRERALARGRAAAPPRHGAPVGLGAVLEHAPDDRVGAHAGTRDVRDLTARVSLS